MIVSDHWQCMQALCSCCCCCCSQAWSALLVAAAAVAQLRLHTWVGVQEVVAGCVCSCAEVVFKTFSSLSGRLFFVQWQDARQDGL